LVKTFHFQDKLREGKKGEDYIFSNSPWIEATDGRKSDFKIVGTDIHGELKSDSYCPTATHPKKTRNFFMERWGNDKKRSPGGPWRAVDDAVEYFVYYFPCCQMYYVFNAQELVDKLDTLIRTKECTKKVIHNRTGKSEWNTIGYTVPISALEDVSRVYNA
jgi:hypothetical protein